MYSKMVGSEILVICRILIVLAKLLIDGKSKKEVLSFLDSIAQRIIHTW